MTGSLRAIPDFPKLLADNKGNVYRVYDNGKQSKLAQKTDKDGYKTIRLQTYGHRKSLKVHRLVCAAFHGKCGSHLMTRHLNGSRSDNTPENLQWGTAQDNSDDKWLHGTMCTKEKHGRARFSQSDIDLIRSRHANEETQTSIANDFKTTQSRISEIITYKT